MPARDHGRSGTPEYRSWLAMIHRCHDQKDELHKRYYADKGIKVCERWHLFTNFFEDMGPKPSPDYTIERYDNAKDYEPGNCRWATKTEQGRNKRNNVLLTHDGKTMPLSAWVEITGLNYTTIHERLRRGWAPERALTTGPIAKVKA